MSASKYSTTLTLLTIFAISAAVDISDTTAETRLPVVKPEHKKDGNEGKDLLSTLQELYHSLVGQIAVLESRQKSALTDDDISETSHLIQHYTAQKNNIEHEISLIQSIEAAPTSAAVPRHILARISSEEKSVPSLLNIFKKPKPSNDATSVPLAYSAPYAPYYYPGYGPQFPYPYQGVQPPKPIYMDTLIQSSFPGYGTQPNINQQTFMERNGVPTSFQSPEWNNSYAQVQTQFIPPPQVSLQGEVPPAPVQPQRVSSTYPPQPQANPPQPQPQPQPTEVQLPPAFNPNGQGVFIYYPNAVITEDDDEEQERPTIVDRVGQAFDRFGQVITNLATLPSLRSAANVNDAHKSETAPTRIRIAQNRPRSSSNQKVPMERKLRWVSV